jgi:hypothetical protein
MYVQFSLSLSLSLSFSLSLFNSKNEDEIFCLIDLFIIFSLQFYLSEKDVGQPRADCLVRKLRELNERVVLSVHNGELNEEFIREFRV